nr:hypothetical protein [Tanacetum cinerariifolium]
MCDQDLVSLLKYIPRYREIEVYIETGVSSVEIHMMNVRLSQGKGVLIEKIVEDNLGETFAGKEVATDTVKEGKLLLLEWNDSSYTKSVVLSESQTLITKLAPLFESCNFDDENMATRTPNALYFSKILVKIDCELEHSGDILMDKGSHTMIPSKSLDEGLVPLMCDQDLVSLLKYIPSGDILMDKGSHTMYRKDDIQNASVSDMLDELQKGNKDVIFSNSDQAELVMVQDVDEEVIEREKDVKEAKDVNGGNESDFYHEEDEIQPTEPEVDMNDLHFQVNAHIDHVTNLACNLEEGFSTWMAFGGNTCDLSSFGEETDEITDLHQILEEVLLTERGDVSQA